MGGSMARKESRAPNGHPAELKKEEETAVQQLAGRRSLLLWGTAYLREHPGFPQKPKRPAGNSMHPPTHTKLWGWMVIHGKTIKFEESLNVCVKLTFRLSFLSVYAQFIRP